jgi:hypothetical protein
MAKRVTGLVIVLLGMLLALTPWYIFPVCGKGRQAPKAGNPAAHHGCANTLKAETALGLLTVGIGLIALMRPTRRVLFSASSALLVLAGFVVLFPLQLTGLCLNSAMPCRTGALPGLVALAVLMAMVSVLGLVQARTLK